MHGLEVRMFFIFKVKVMFFWMYLRVRHWLHFIWHTVTL